MSDPITTPEALKPCPFCGDSGRLWSDPSHSTAYFAGCGTLDCPGEMYWNESKAAVIAAWNRRVPNRITVAEAADRLIENLRTFLSHYADKDARDGYPAMLRAMIADAETLRRALIEARP